MARKPQLQPGALRLLDLRAAATVQPKIVAGEYQLRQSRHTTPRYRVAVPPQIREGKLFGWTGHSPWTADRALAERWLADKREAMAR